MTIEMNYEADEILKEYWEGLTFAEFLTDISESDDISQTELSRRLGKSRQFISGGGHERDVSCKYQNNPGDGDHADPAAATTHARRPCGP